MIGSANSKSSLWFAMMNPEKNRDYSNSPAWAAYGQLEADTFQSQMKRTEEECKARSEARKAYKEIQKIDKRQREISIAAWADKKAATTELPQDIALQLPPSGRIQG